MEIIVKNQADLDKIKKDFDGYIYIEGGTYENPIVYEINFEKAYVVSRGTAYLYLKGNAQVGAMRGTFPSRSNAGNFPK